MCSRCPSAFEPRRRRFWRRGGVRDFEAAFPASCGGLEVENLALDPDDGGHMRLPFRSSDSRLGFEHGDGAGFVAVTPVLVEAAFARQRLGDRTNGLDVSI